MPSQQPGHLYFRKTDENPWHDEDGGELPPLNRAMHVCRALPDGVHVDVVLRGEDGERIDGAGMNLTMVEADLLRDYLTTVLTGEQED